MTRVSAASSLGLLTSRRKASMSLIYPTSPPRSVSVAHSDRTQHNRQRTQQHLRSDWPHYTGLPAVSHVHIDPNDSVLATGVVRSPCHVSTVHIRGGTQLLCFIDSSQLYKAVFLSTRNIILHPRNTCEDGTVKVILSAFKSDGQSKHVVIRACTFCGCARTTLLSVNESPPTTTYGMPLDSRTDSTPLA